MKLIRYFVVPVMLTALASPGLAQDPLEAQGTLYKVTFEDNGKAPKDAIVTVLFTAVGCFGARLCFDGGQGMPITRVCKQTLKLRPGKTTEYKYKPVHSKRNVTVCPQNKALTYVVKGSSRRHTHVCARPDGTFVLRGGKNCGTKTSE